MRQNIDEMRDVKIRVTAVELGLAGLRHRMDRVDERLDRIGRRLELTEAPGR